MLFFSLSDLVSLKQTQLDVQQITSCYLFRCLCFESTTSKKPYTELFTLIVHTRPCTRVWIWPCKGYRKERESLCCKSWNSALLPSISALARLGSCRGFVVVLLPYIYCSTAASILYYYLACTTITYSYVKGHQPFLRACIIIFVSSSFSGKKLRWRNNEPFPFYFSFESNFLGKRKKWRREKKIHICQSTSNDLVGSLSLKHTHALFFSLLAALGERGICGLYTVKAAFWKEIRPAKKEWNTVWPFEPDPFSCGTQGPQQKNVD